MFGFLKPAPYKERIAKDKIDPAYKKLRLQVFLSIFIGYAVYYLVRKNVALAAPDMIKMGWSKTDIGFIMASLSFAYAFSKFLMGSVSDKSNPRYFFPIGLMLSGGVMLYVGFMDLTIGAVSVGFLALLMFINGWVQGMGWPPSGKTLVHWFSTKERGRAVSIWNLAHNVGGGLIANVAIWGVGYFNDWQATFYVPAGIAIGAAIILLFTMRDTPQSVGLPAIEEYKHDYPMHYNEDYEKILSFREIFFKYIFNNKYLWFIAIANAFVYLVRNGVVDWAPTYLSETKNFSFKQAGWAYALYEYAAIPGTLLCGWASDKFFNSRRGPIGVIFMLFTLGAVLWYWLATQNISYSLALVCIGFLIYGPVMLIGLHALDLVPKKAAGTAAGFTGMFGYLIGDVLAKAILGNVIDNLGWNAYFIIIVASCVLAMFFLSLTWREGGKHKESWQPTK